MVDHHVDRPGVEAVQAAQLTGTNRSIGLIPHPVTQRRTGNQHFSQSTEIRGQRTEAFCPLTSDLGRPGGHGEGLNTRSHPELGRENPQRRWYCVSRRGRVGRRQVYQDQNTPHKPPQTNTPAGWSSPVARQAHNLKVRGSNPLPATRKNLCTINYINPLGPPFPAGLAVAHSCG